MPTEGASPRTRNGKPTTGAPDPSHLRDQGVHLRVDPIGPRVVASVAGFDPQLGARLEQTEQVKVLLA
jgi:hypothetical protein